MRTIPLLFLAALLLKAAPGVPTPSFTDPERRRKLEKAFAEIDKAFETFYRSRGTPGLVYGVVIDGELVHVKGFGIRERGRSEEVTADTVFRIASMTKSFTALAMLKLRDEGKVSLDDPVSRWIPELRVVPPTGDAAPIRVRDLLTHGAGLPEDNPWGDQQLAISESQMDAWLRRGLPFSSSPDTAFEYSNYGFALAGRVISRASGTTYRDYLEKQILGPLGMRASSLEPSAVNQQLRATGYRRSGSEYSEEPSLAHGAFGAMGGLLTSARDLARFVAFQLSAYPARDEPDPGPVRRSSVREMQRAWRKVAFNVDRTPLDGRLRASSVAYGYGLNVTADCSFGQLVSHGGGLPGFGSYMAWLPEYGVGMFGMSNLTYTSPAPAIFEGFEALRKTGALKPRVLPPAEILITTRDAIVRLWKEWKDAAAEELAADNLFKDTPAAERRKEMERIRKEMGECRDPGQVKPLNLLRGSFRMPCEQGFVDVQFTLAPTNPPKVQFLRFSSSRNLSASMKKLAEQVAGLIASPDEGRLKDLVVPQALDSVRRQLQAAARSYGSCKLSDAEASVAGKEALVRFECERGPLAARLTIEDSGMLSAVSLNKPPDEPCVP